MWNLEGFLRRLYLPETTFTLSQAKTKALFMIFQNLSAISAKSRICAFSNRRILPFDVHFQDLLIGILMFHIHLSHKASWQQQRSLTHYEVLMVRLHSQVAGSPSLLRSTVPWRYRGEMSFLARLQLKSLFDRLQE